MQARSRDVLGSVSLRATSLSSDLLKAAMESTQVSRIRSKGCVA